MSRVVNKASLVSSLKLTISRKNNKPKKAELNLKFHDLTFLYDVKRFVRAKYIAAQYKQVIAGDLKTKFKKVRRDNFNEFLEDGGSLTM